MCIFVKGLNWGLANLWNMSLILRIGLFVNKFYCMESVHIRSFSGQYFPAFGLNTDLSPYLSVFSPNAGKYGPEKPNTDTFHAVFMCTDETEN